MYSTQPQTNKRNILYIANEGNLKGGGQLSVWNLVTRLNKDRFRLFFICPSEGSFADMLREAGIDVEIVIFPSLKKINPFAIISTIVKIKRIINEKKIDIVHSNGPRMSLVSGIAAKLAKIAVVWHERTLVEKGMWDSDRFFSFLADRIICNSEAIRQRFLKNGKIHRKIITIINGVDTALFNPSVDGSYIRREFDIKDSEIVIGMASRIDPTKGQLYLIQAAAALTHCHPNLKFLISGGVFGQRFIDYKNSLDELIVQENLQDKIIFTDIRNDMLQIMAAINILVLASDAEGCGRVLFEAMASGKPVVATNTGGTPEIVLDKETGLLVPPKDSKSLTEAISVLLSDSKLAEDMGKKARKRVEEYFTIEEHVKKTEKVYRELLNGKE
jgi:glycosyltransferase involved in cell wall biosynthesis